MSSHLSSYGLKLLGLRSTTYTHIYVQRVDMTMAALRGQLRALSNDRELRCFVVQATPTGVHLGPFGSVEEVWPSE